MIQILILGLLVIVMIMGAIAYVNFNPSEKEIVKEKTKGLVPSDVKERVIKGALFDNCPCADGYECSVNDGNICKIKEGGACNGNSDCSSNAFCFNSVCTLIPNETIGTKDSIKMNKNPMILEKNRFVVPKNLWTLQDIIDICPSPTDENIVYMLSAHGKIHKVDMTPSVPNTIEITSYPTIDRLFTFDNKFYALSNFKLYQLENEKDGERVWYWNKVNKIFNEDVSNMEFLEASTVDTMLVFNTREGIYNYDKGAKEGEKWSGPDKSILRIEYGIDRNTYIKETIDGEIIYLVNGKEHKIHEDAIDFAVKKDSSNTIYLLTREGTCYSNQYNRKDGSDVSLCLVGKVNRIICVKGKLWALSAKEEYLL